MRLRRSAPRKARVRHLDDFTRCGVMRPRSGGCLSAHGQAVPPPLKYAHPLTTWHPGHVPSYTLPSRPQRHHTSPHSPDGVARYAVRQAHPQLAPQPAPSPSAPAPRPPACGGTMALPSSPPRGRRRPKRFLKSYTHPSDGSHLGAAPPHSSRLRSAASARSCCFVGRHAWASATTALPPAPWPPSTAPPSTPPAALARRRKSSSSSRGWARLLRGSTLAAPVHV
jgi:hypothetical protein